MRWVEVKRYIECTDDMTRVRIYLCTRKYWIQLFRLLLLHLLLFPSLSQLEFNRNEWKETWFEAGFASILNIEQNNNYQEFHTIGFLLWNKHKTGLTNDLYWRKLLLVICNIIVCICMHNMCVNRLLPIYVFVYLNCIW